MVRDSSSCAVAAVWDMGATTACGEPSVGASAAAAAPEDVTGGVGLCRSPSAAWLALHLERCSRAGTESGTVSGVTAACMVAAALEHLTGGVAACTEPSAASPAWRLERFLCAGTESGTASGASVACSEAAALHLVCSVGACSGAKAVAPLAAAQAERSRACGTDANMLTGVESGKACAGDAVCLGLIALCLERFAGACSGADALVPLAAARAERSRACGTDAGISAGVQSGKACAGGAACSGTAAVRLERFAGA